MRMFSPDGTDRAGNDGYVPDDQVAQDGSGDDLHAAADDGINISQTGSNVTDDGSGQQVTGETEINAEPADTDDEFRGQGTFDV